MVAEDAESQAGQDRYQGGQAFAVCGVPDDRSGCSEGTFSRNS